MLPLLRVTSTGSPVNHTEQRAVDARISAPLPSLDLAREYGHHHSSAIRPAGVGEPDWTAADNQNRKLDYLKQMERQPASDQIIDGSAAGNRADRSFDIFSKRRSGPMGLGIGTGRGGQRVGAGRPKGVKTRWPPEIAAELRRLADGLQRLQQYRRNEHEALQPILRRLVAIERALGLREKIEAPRVSRRRPLGG